MTGNARKAVVVLDANALLMPFQFRINLDLELERLLGAHDVVVPSSVIDELRKLAKDGGLPVAALRLAAKYRTHPSDGAGDDAVLAAALGLGAFLLTLDAELRRRARRADLKVIGLRGRSHLELL